jgi:hypothetical protein
VKGYKCYAVIDVPSGLTEQKTQFLDSFAEFYHQLRASFVRCDPIRLLSQIAFPVDFTFDISKYTFDELISIAADLLGRFEVGTFLKAENLQAWVGDRANMRPSVFNFMVTALHFAHTILAQSQTLSLLAPGFRAALALFVFLDISPPECQPICKYHKLLAKSIPPEAPTENIAKVASLLSLMSEEPYDILSGSDSDKSSELMAGLFRQCPLKRCRSVAYFHAVLAKLDLGRDLHQDILAQTIIEGGRHAHFFYPLGAFKQCIKKLDRTDVLANGESPATMIAKEFAQFRTKFVSAVTAVSQKANWLRVNL